MDPDRRSRALGRTLDLALAGAVLVGGLIRDAQRISPTPGRTVAPYLLDLSGWLLVLIHVLGALALLWRRTHPLVVAAAVAALAILAPVFAAMVMPYSVARYVPELRRCLPVCAGLVVAVLTGADLWGELGSWDSGFGDPYTPTLVMAGVTAAGLYMRARSDLIEQVQARADAAVREGRLVAEQQRLRDRAALARNLHDIGAHWVTLMTMQAAALSVQATDPAVRAEAEQLRDKGERALNELHRLIRVLAASEEEAETLDPVPEDPRSLSTLVEESGPGLSVRFDETGESVVVPEPQRLLARHIVMEAMVNATKYAPGGSVEVRVDWGKDRVEVDVSSRAAAPDHSSQTGPGAGRGPAAPRSPGSAVGLRALAERCRGLGGSLRAEEGSGPGTFVVRATLPYREVA